MANKTESNKPKKVLYNASLIIYFLAMVTLLLLCIYVDLNKMKIYFAGCIWDSSFISSLLMWLTLFISVIDRLSALKNTTDMSFRKKLIKWLWFAGLFCILIAGFIVYEYIDNIQENKQDHIAAVNIDDNKGILFVENHNKLSDGSQYNSIIVYRKDWITLKRIDYIYEHNFINNSMIADHLYNWECNDNAITVQFDYGGLNDGCTWANEEWNISPPEYIEKIYELSA